MCCSAAALGHSVELAKAAREKPEADTADEAAILVFAFADVVQELAEARSEVSDRNKDGGPFSEHAGAPDSDQAMTDSPG